MAQFLRPVTTIKPRPTNPTLSRYIRSYLIMRAVVGALAIMLPFVLVLCDGLWFDGDPFPRGSLTAYYYSGMRDLLVGTLCASGVFLIAYKVAERNLDNALSLFAGVAACVIALFPGRLPENVSDLSPLQDRLGESAVATIHFVAAAAFISALAVMSYYFGMREGTRDPQVAKRRPRRFWRFYHWICAAVIVAALLWMGLTQIVASGPNEALLYGESVALMAFGASWLWKGLELDMLRGRPSALLAEAAQPS